MAAAFTKENENFCRLVVLINETGLDALRASLEFFSTQKYGVTTFQQVLQLPTVQRKLTTLKGPGKGKPISPYQWDVLYPPPGTPVTVKDLDITLCFVLIRNITGLRQPLTSWDKPPAPGDNSLEGGLAQIKFLRNTLCHKDSPSVSDVDFDSYYNDIEKALLDISASGHWGIYIADVMKFRNLPMSPQQIQGVEDLVKEWYDQERDLLAESTEGIQKVTKENYQKGTKETYAPSLIVKVFGIPFIKSRCIQHLRRYYKTMMGKIQRIPWEEEDKFDLEDMYVNLSQVIVDKRTGRKEVDIDHYTKMIQEGTGVKIIVQGHAGMGKTTLVSKMVVDWAKGKWGFFKWWKSYFPLVLKLRELSDQQNLAVAVKSQLFQDLDISFREIYKLLKIYEKDIVLLLDGFDEFSVEGFSEIRELIKGEWFQDMSVILTTRPWRTKEVQDSWDKLVEIKGFKKKDVNVYIDNFFKTVRNGQTKSEKFKEEIEKEQYYPLFETPLVVLFNCLVFLDEEKIYSRLTDQYKAVIGCMKIRASDKGHDFIDKDYEIIEDLALQGLLAGEKGLIFSAMELERFNFKKNIFHLGFFAVVKRPYEGFRNRELVFTHKTLQEYLAACSLVRLRNNGDQSKLQEVESHCQNPKRILEMGKLLQFCCSLDEELKKVILPRFSKILISVSSKQISSKEFMMIELTKETFNICQAYNSCVSDHCRATERIMEANEIFLPVAEKYNYSILFHKNSGVILGITSSDQNKLLEKTKDLIEKQTEYEVTEEDQILVFDCDLSSHLEHEISDVLHYMTLCNKLKIIEISACSPITSQTSHHPLYLLNEAKTPLVEELTVTRVGLPLEVMKNYLRSVSKLEKLNISWNKVGDEGAKVLGENFKFIPNLKELHIHGNDIYPKGCFHLATGLHFVPKLRKLDVSWNNIGEEGARALAENFQFIPNLEELLICDNKISSTGCCHLAKHLHFVPKLRKLDVRGNDIGEEGAKVLGENFQFIPNLEELFIGRNAFSSEAFHQVVTHFDSVPNLKKHDIDWNVTGEEGDRVLGDKAVEESSHIDILSADNFEENILREPKSDSKYAASAIALDQKEQPSVGKVEERIQGEASADCGSGVTTVEKNMGKALDMQKSELDVKENLKLAKLLLQSVGHDLKRIEGFSRYSLNADHMKMKVVVLQDEAVMKVEILIKEKIENIYQLKRKNVSELVHIEVEDELPMIVADFWPGLDVSFEQSEPMRLTAGVPFKLVVRENVTCKTLVPTCTHGLNFCQAKFTTKVDECLQSFFGDQTRYGEIIPFGEYGGNCFNINTANKEIDLQQAAKEVSTVPSTDPPEVDLNCNRQSNISIDICMLELNPELEGMYYPRDPTEHVRVTEMMNVDENLLGQPVQKVGSSTHVTYGQISDINLCSNFRYTIPGGPRKGEIVILIIEGGIETKPLSTYEQQCQASPQPNGRFAIKGDSGSTITTREDNSEVKAISQHLFSVKFKNQNDVSSLSCPLKEGKEQFEETYEIKLAFEPSCLPIKSSSIFVDDICVSLKKKCQSKATGT